MGELAESSQWRARISCRQAALTRRAPVRRSPLGSKKYRNKLCVYCCRQQSVTGDHVFAREFFLPSRRNELPQVPTCDRCNNEKSKLEHYLTAVLPFGGRHRDALESLTTLVPKRLARNEKLHRHLATRKNDVWTLENGFYQKTTAIPVAPESIERLFSLIARGLAWHHWNLYLTEEHELKALILTSYGQDIFERCVFSLNAAQRVQISLGEGAVQYEGVQATDCPHITIWRFTMYGGQTMAGDPTAPGEVCSQIVVITGLVNQVGTKLSEVGGKA